MKIKTIRRILRREFDAWHDSIPRKKRKLRKLIRENSIISGGSIVSMLQGTKVSDFDVYFRTKETALAVAKYYVSLFKENNKDLRFEGGGRVADIHAMEGEEGRIRIVIKSAGIASATKSDNYQYFESLEPGSPEQEEFIEGAFRAGRLHKELKGKYLPIFLSSNAISLSDNFQLITRFYGEAEEIHKNFDFIHCTCYWKSWDGELVLPKAALESILTKELRYSGSLYPLCSLFRMRKFIKKGWTINAGQILKIALQISQMNLLDISILEDQLIGVDVAYMMDLINRLRAEKEEKIDEIYICRLVDEIF